MEFITVTHKDGRTADITAGEVAFYQSIGFHPADGTVVDGETPASEPAGLPAPIDGTEQRLDLLIGEIRGLRADIATVYAPLDFGIEITDGETVAIREPQTPDGTDVPEGVPTLEWSRPDLDAFAAGKGLADADKLPNKQAVLDAIAAAS